VPRSSPRSNGSETARVVVVVEKAVRRRRPTARPGIANPPVRLAFALPRALVADARRANLTKEVARVVAFDGVARIDRRSPRGRGVTTPNR
jgi:hypothetical protein